jgi:hypothetical protein
VGRQRGENLTRDGDIPGGGEGFDGGVDFGGVPAQGENVDGSQA